MCLALPGKIIAKQDTKATVDFGGVQREADLTLLPNATIGDYILVHVGFAIQKINEKKAKELYRLLSSTP